MVIKNLKLVNYRRFANLSLELPENLIGIIGRNGTGKSTMVEAIGWALFGNRIARTDKQDIRSQFLQDNSPCSTEIEILYGQHEYRILRQLKGKNAVSEAAIYRDGRPQPEAVQERGVNEYIESLLKLDYRSFLASAYARQKDLAALSSMQPEERRRTINRLIGIDQIDHARERVRRDRNEKRAFVEGMRTSLKEPDVLQRQREELHDLHSTKLAAESGMQEVVKDKSQLLSKAKEALEVQSQKRDLHLQWEAHLGKLTSRMRENELARQRSKAELGEIAHAEEELQSLSAELALYEKVKTEKERLDAEATKAAKLEGKRKEKTLVEHSLAKETARANDLSFAAGESEQCEKTLAEIKAKEHALETLVAELHEKAKFAAGKKEAVKRAGLEAKEKLQRIKELGPNGQCPVCTQALHDHYEAVVADLEQQLGDLRIELRSTQEEENKANEELKLREGELRTLRQGKEQLIKQQSSAMDAAKNLARAKEAIVTFADQLALIEKDILLIGQVDYDESRHKQLRLQFEKSLKLKELAAQLAERSSRRPKVKGDIQRMEQTIEEIEAELREAKDRQAALGFDDAEYQSSKQEVEKKNLALDEAKEALAKVREELAGLRKEIDRLDAEIAEQELKRQQIEQAEEEIVYLNALEEHFGRFRLELAGRIRPLIAHRASELLSLTTQARYSTVELDEDYNIRIWDGNIPFAIERFSGGEQDLANLCLRIAISQVVTERSGGAPINFIVLDEIFGSQDAERQSLIMQALGQLSSQFRQIFLITHIDSIKDMLPVIVEVTMEDDQTSSARIV